MNWCVYICTQLAVIQLLAQITFPHVSRSQTARLVVVVYKETVSINLPTSTIILKVKGLCSPIYCRPCIHPVASSSDIFFIYMDRRDRGQRDSMEVDVW
jgi:hypothetical protein